MPKYLQYIAWSAVAFTGLAVAVLVFGPQEGLETLAGGLLAYFALLYHILVGPLFILHWIQSRRKPFAGLTPGLATILAYLGIIYGIGLTQFILSNDLDVQARDFLDARTAPMDYRLRELGRELHFQYLRGESIDTGGRHEWLRLVDEAEDVNKKGEQGMPALWYAAAMGDLEMANALLSRGAVTDDAELFYKSPLAAAVAEGHVAMVERLAAHGADVNQGENRHTPSLTVAARNGNRDMAAVTNDDAMLTVLLDKTRGFEARAEGRDPVLFSLFFECNLTDFRRFLDLGADPDVRSNSGQPLFVSLIYANSRKCDFEPVRLAMAEALIEAGADVDVLSTSGERLTPFALWKSRIAVARILVAADADLSGEIAKKDFLMLASRRGQVDLVRAGLDRGFDPNYWSKGLNRSNAMLEAAREGHPDVLGVLIEGGGRPPQADGDLRLLHRGAADAGPTVLQLLLDRFPLSDYTEARLQQIRWAVDGSNNEASKALLASYLDR